MTPGRATTGAPGMEDDAMPSGPVAQGDVPDQRTAVPDGVVRHDNLIAVVSAGGTGSWDTIAIVSPSRSR